MRNVLSITTTHAKSDSTSAYRDSHADSYPVKDTLRTPFDKPSTRGLTEMIPRTARCDCKIDIGLTANSNALNMPEYFTHGIAPKAVPSISDLATKTRPPFDSETSERNHRRAWDADDFGPIMPSQYFEGIRNSSFLTGEQKLFFAVLEDAIRCYVQARNQTCLSKQVELFELREWFDDPHESGPFSFESVCATLNINPECLRKRLDTLSVKDIPLQRLCNRRRLGRSGSRSMALKILAQAEV